MAGGEEVWRIAAGLDGAALTSFCFTKILGSFGGFLVSASMAAFAFATIAVSYTHLETLMASKHAHEVLTWVYGDYMKLPPEAERVPAHSTIDIQVFDEEA